MELQEPKVYIVVLNYNNWQDTIECLESIYSSDYKNYNIVVVDNSIDNNSIDRLQAWARGKLIFEASPFVSSFVPKPIDYKLFHEEEIKKIEPSRLTFIKAENRGYAAGNNVGIQYALLQGDMKYVWLLNNDTVVQRDTLSMMVQSTQKNSKIGAVGSIQYYYHEPHKIQSAGGGFSKYRAHFWNINKLDFKQDELAYIYGASMLLTKKVIQEVGLLSEDYFIYYEEIDYMHRMKEKGFLPHVNKEAKIYHKHSSTISKEGEEFRLFHLEKGKLIFYKKFYPNLLFIPIAKIFWKFLKSGKKVYLKALQVGLK